MNYQVVLSSFLLSSNRYHSLSIRCGVYSRMAFICNFASICAVYLRVAFNRINMVVCLFRNEKGIEAKMYPTIVSGIVTGDALVSYWPVFFSVPFQSHKSLPRLTRPSSFLVFKVANVFKA